MDDSARGVSNPSTVRAWPRTAPQPAGYSPSKWDESGRRAGGWEKSPIDKDEEGQSLTRASLKQSFHFPFDLREGGFQHTASRIDHYFALGIQLVEPEADGLANPSLDAIANHGFADGARQGKADFGTLAFRPQSVEGGEQRPGVPAALIVNSAEIGGSQNTDTFWETCDVTTSRS